MKDDKGKVIFSLIAGATAGIVAGLLLAPETGDDTRSNLRKSASKWADDLGKLAKDALAKAQGQAPGHTNPDAAVSEDKEAADRLLAGLDTNTRTPSEAAKTEHIDFDGYGDSDDTRPQPNL
jgi:gas vesicle protein